MVVDGKKWSLLKLIIKNLNCCSKKIIKYQELSITMASLNKLVQFFLSVKNVADLVTSNFNDIIIRDQNFQIKKNNTKGIIQLLSTLPTSYPGHSILTEDVGEICGISDCNCGRKGKYFRVHGRIEKSEIRGCSNV